MFWPIMRFFFLKKRYVKNECHFSRRVKTAWKNINWISSIPDPRHQQGVKLPRQQFTSADMEHFSATRGRLPAPSLSLLFVLFYSLCTARSNASPGQAFCYPSTTMFNVLVADKGKRSFWPVYGYHQLVSSAEVNMKVLVFVITESLKIKNCWGQMW